MVDSWYNEMEGNWENAFLITGVRYKRVLSHTFNCAWGEEYHSLHRSVGKKGLDTPRKTPKWNRQGCLLSRLLYCVCYITYSFLLIILLLSVWISDETLSLVFNILLPGDWISDESLRVVFDILLIVFGYQMKHPFSCSQCLHIRWNTPSRVWYITYRCLIIRWIVFDISHHAIWISNETILVVFDV